MNARQTDAIRAGRRLRRLRQELGLTQVQMAQRLGVSASYFNLLEHDRRPLTRKLARRLEERFGAGTEAFSDSEDRRLLAALMEIAADPIVGDRAIGEDEARDTVSAAPDAARMTLALYRAYRTVREEAAGLGEELRSRDVLAGINYEFRNVVAAIRSLAEILQDNPDLDADRRRQFIATLVADSKRLVPLVEALPAAEPGARAPVDGRPPGEEVADFFQANAGYFAALEDAAHMVEPADIAGQRPALAETLSLEGRRLASAKGAAAARCADIIARCADTARWSTAEARALAMDALADYLAAAILMPYESFLAAARELRHDIERLRRRFGVGFEQVCRRLTALRRPGAKGIPFHMVKIDMAGNVTWRMDGSNLRLPRHGGLCPLWNLHAAFLSPEVTRAQLSRLPDGLLSFSIARAVRAEAPEIVGSPRFVAIELGCDASFARAIVYADGLDLSDRATAVPIGSTCRLCERPDCAERVVPPFRRPPTTSAGEPTHITA